jgi:hypothetical protein
MDDDGIHELLSQRASETDEERVKLRNRLQYAVLDSLMQAQEKFLVSHLSWDFETRQKKEPAQIVVLLSEYVESQFMIEEGSFKKQAGCLDWNFLHKKERQNSIIPSLKYKKKESVIPVKTFLSALSDPLAYFMKMHYGQKKWGAFSAPPSLFATTRDLVRMVDKELLSPSRYMPKKHRKGVSQALIHKECHEMKQHCHEKMKPHLEEKEIERQSLSFDERALFSSVQLKGDLSLFSPVADIILVEDPKKAIADIWPKLALLAGLEKELLALHIEPAILFPLQGVKKQLPGGYSMAALEEFWILLQETPFPFQADFLPTLMGSKASFYAFESLLQEKIEEKNRIFTSFSFSHDATERSRLYPLWQEVAEKLIGPWYHWLEKEES